MLWVKQILMEAVRNEKLSKERQQLLWHRIHQAICEFWSQEKILLGNETER